jgi:fatty acid desaturase
MAAECNRLHQWSDDIRRDVGFASSRDNWHCVLELAEDFFVIAAAIAAPYLIQRSFARFGGGWFAWLATYIFVAVPLIGIRMRALAELLHQSTHRTLAANTTLNFIAGTFLSGYLVLQSWSPYLSSHVLRHHHKFGGNDDPDYQYHIQEGLYDEQNDGRFLWRYLISPLLLFKTPSKLVDLFRNRFFNREEPAWEGCLKMTYLAAIVTIVTATGLGWHLLLFWGVPFVTVFPIVNWYVELTEHYPLVQSGRQDIHRSRNRWTGLVGRFLTGIHNEHLHLVHHLFPGVPAWRLPQVHQILMRDPEYRACQNFELGLVFPVVSGIPSILANILKLHPHRP